MAEVCVAGLVGGEVGVAQPNRKNKHKIAISLLLTRNPFDAPSRFDDDRPDYDGCPRMRSGGATASTSKSFCPNSCTVFSSGLGIRRLPALERSNAICKPLRHLSRASSSNGKIIRSRASPPGNGSQPAGIRVPARGRSQFQNPDIPLPSLDPPLFAKMINYSREYAPLRELCLRHPQHLGHRKADDLHGFIVQAAQFANETLFRD